MKNMNKIICMLMIITLTSYASISGAAANAITKASLSPQVKISGLAPTYKFNNALKFNITTLNYTRKVKYKLSLYNFDSKKTIELTKGYSKSIGCY